MSSLDIENLEAQLLELKFKEVTNRYVKIGEKMFSYYPSNSKLDGFIVVNTAGKSALIRSFIEDNESRFLECGISKVIKCVVEQIKIIENLPTEKPKRRILSDYGRIREDGSVELCSKEMAFLTHSYKE
jgi:hypothetical protein